MKMINLTSLMVDPNQTEKLIGIYYEYFSDYFYDYFNAADMGRFDRSNFASEKTSRYSDGSITR